MTLEIDVVLVRPKEDGNVGAVARVGRNFGVHRLTLVAPRARLGSEARRRAMGGARLLAGARRVRSLDEALADVDMIVGTTDMSLGRSVAYRRRAVSPERLGDMLHMSDGRVALVFGPEDDGLSRSELERCDLVVHIPARRDFPTLNLSHAAGLVLYAFHRSGRPADPDSTPEPERITLNGKEKELFYSRLAELVAGTEYPRHKRRGLLLLARRVLGRAMPSEAEFRMLLGFLKSVLREVENTHARRRRVAAGPRHRP